MFQEQKPLAAESVEAAATARKTSPRVTPSHRSAHIGRWGRGSAALASLHRTPRERARKCSCPGMLRAA
eukprot:15451688-Alexandrium_andersonii.AAC.1